MTARVPLAVALGFVVAVLASVPAIAQPPGPPGAPPRDVRPAATGTAVIRGRITAGDTGRPLRRARIRLTSPELPPQGLMTSTNPDGKYEIKDLPAGRYTLQVMRSGYLTLNYGQRRPLEAGKPLQVFDKQVVENIDFALPRTSVITGRVIDELNEPVASALVFAMRTTFFQGRRRMVPVTQASTDDAGQYRLTGLSPGSYYVMALLRDTWTVVENGVETTLGYETTYFPGSPGLTNARRVIVEIGQEAGGTDFALVPGRSANVSGVAFDSRGRPMAGRGVSLGQEISGPSMGMMMSTQSATIAPDGSFILKNVPPGEYKLRAQTTVDGKTPGVQITEAATLPIVVEGVDLTNLQLSTSSGWTARGQIVSDTGTAPGIPTAQVRLVGRMADTDTAPTNTAGMNVADSGRVKDDWTFVVSPLFGSVRLAATLPDGWAVKTILHAGEDITDRAVEMKSGEEMADVQVIVTNRVTTVSGQLADEKGAPITDGTVIVFAAEAEKWAEDSRWVRSARPDQQGQYQIKGLPAGSYLAVAVDYVESGMWNDPEYLNSIRKYGQPITLLDAGSQALSLKLITPQ
jgi:hypothetical protein